MAGTRRTPAEQARRDREIPRPPPGLELRQEPYHRRWLHAVEADMSVPGDVMQVARVYADYAASRGGRVASVSYSAMRRQTHRRLEVIAGALRHLAAHGWLVPEPAVRGRQRTYQLAIPLRTGGEVAATSPDGGRGPCDLSGQGEGSSPDGGSATSPDGGRHTSTSDVLPAGPAHPCRYARCRGPDAPVDVDGYHETCRYLAQVVGRAGAGP